MSRLARLIRGFTARIDRPSMRRAGFRGHPALISFFVLITASTRIAAAGFAVNNAGRRAFRNA